MQITSFIDVGASALNLVHLLQRPNPIMGIQIGLEIGVFNCRILFSAHRADTLVAVSIWLTIQKLKINKNP